jgi:Heparinase II/III-like protein/Heparinase II/III N-terminus
VRSRREIWFRARQEATNLAMLARPPAPGVVTPPGPPKGCTLPNPVETAARLRGSAFAVEVEGIARRVLRHRIPLLGIEIDAGPQIEWRRDSVHGISSATPYFRRSPYLDFMRVGDHKLIWELNRHQHLVLLAQAFRFTGEQEFLDEVFRELESWLDANPFLRGINWASALEVGFRALSWMWVWLLAGDQFPETLARRFVTTLYRHGCFLERNLSFYFSPNTHLLGEAVALHALGKLFPAWPRASRWAEVGGGVVCEQIERQVRPDGGHFEQSAYYHVYALDFFLLYRAVASGAVGKNYDVRLQAMAEYLDALLGPSGILPYLGDDDGGRVFHPYGDRARFGHATLATCAALFGRPEWLGDAESRLYSSACQADWWLGERAHRASSPLVNSPQQSRLFADVGVAVMISADRQIVVKAGPFGEGSGGHSHSDVLSLVARIGPREVLIDPGTYTYVTDAEERERYRGSAAHNTIRIDERDQARPAGPFRWQDKPAASVREWNSSAETDYLDASCAYAGFTHRRQIRFMKHGYVVVLDTVDGPPGDHLLEQFWHLNDPEDAARLAFTASAEILEGWRSRALAMREPVRVLRVSYRGSLPTQMASVLDLSANPAPGDLTLHSEGQRTVITWNGGRAEFVDAHTGR